MCFVAVVVDRSFFGPGDPVADQFIKVPVDFGNGAIQCRVSRTTHSSPIGLGPPPALLSIYKNSKRHLRPRRMREPRRTQA
jgi:hypothetical protein